MLEIKTQFSRRELMWFGPLFALFAAMVSAVLLRQFDDRLPAILISVVAALIIVVYYAVPAWRRSIYRGWLYSVAPIGLVASSVLLAAVYYLLLTPIGFTMRRFGYDPLRLEFDREAKSYWVPRTEASDAKGYFRQY